MVLGHVRRSSKKGRVRGSGARINQREFVGTHLVWLIDCCSFSRRTAGDRTKLWRILFHRCTVQNLHPCFEANVLFSSTTVALKDTNSYS
jgi:hypothetical protein